MILKAFSIHDQGLLVYEDYLVFMDKSVVLRSTLDIALVVKEKLNSVNTQNY